MYRRALACGILLGLSACGSTTESPKESSNDRLLLLVWNYPDTGVTRLLADLHDHEDEAAAGPVMLVPEDDDEVEVTATLRSPRHSVPLEGSYDHEGDYFSLTHRSGADSIIMFGIYRPTQPLSPVITDMTFSGPPAGNGGAYGIRDTVGTARFFCASYTLTDTAVTRSFGLIITDSLVIGLGGALPVPFSGDLHGDSLALADGALHGHVSADRSTVEGSIVLGAHSGHWSGQRCDVTN